MNFSNGIVFTIILIISIFSINVNGDLNTCMASVGGNSINLGQYTEQYSYLSPNSNFTYYFAFCQNAPFCISNTADKSSAICQFQKEGNTYSFGQSSNYSIVNDKITYNGDTTKWCGTNPKTTRTGFINLSCSSSSSISVSSIVEPKTAQNPNGGPNCQITLNVNIPCAIKGGLGGGWIFIIIIFSGAAVYIIFGVIINWKIRHQHGAEIFPNIGFWRSAGQYVKDGVFFIKGKISGTPYSGGGYTAV